MTYLRHAMLEELQRRNYATTTVYYYLKAVEQFAKYFHTSPDQLNQSHLRRYQAYLQGEIESLAGDEVMSRARSRLK